MPRESNGLAEEVASRIGLATVRWRMQILGGLRIVTIGNAKGEICLEGDDEALNRFRTHRAALLLVRLLLQPGRSLSRDELSDWLWPDAPADRGRANLSQTLLFLRRQFANDSRVGQKCDTALFVTDHQTIRLRPQTFETDVARFERLLREARAPKMDEDSPQERVARWDAVLEAYSGDLLPGFYDDWIEGERRRLSEMRDAAQSCWHQAREQIENRPIAPVRLPSVPDSDEASALVGDLPLTMTRFFGRSEELARLGDLLTQTLPATLVTLVGTGGIGKTRLAIEAARLLRREFGFVAFVPLADVTDAELTGSAVLQALQVPEDGPSGAKTDDALSRAIHFLKEMARTHGRLLLLLDNLEQLGGTCAPQVGRLLAQVPSLTILATSRQPLGVPGEQEVAIGPLQSVAATQGDAGNDSLPAIALFVDRARLVRPDFSVTPQNRAAISDLCRLLEGIPLALELAAPWIRSLAPAQITARLKNRFDLLTRRGAPGDSLPQRHQSLRAAIAWSYDLLPLPQQTLWAQLSVFRGGWTLEAAQAVSGIEDLSIPLLLLAERSLILAEIDEATGTLRYRMLESLREFAEEQRPSWGDACESLRLRHAQYFETLSCQAEQMIKKGRGNRDALVLLGPERDNIGAALRFTLDPAQAEEAARIAGIRLTLQSGWLRSCAEQQECLRQAAEGLAYLPELVGLPLRAHILFQQGNMARYLGSSSEAEQKIGESLALWNDLGDEREAIAVKMGLGSIVKSKNLGRAIALWTECRDFARRANQPLLEAAALNNMANADTDLGQSRVWIEQAVALDRRHASGTDSLACSLNSMGGIAFAQNDLETTRACLEEAHQIAMADGGMGMMGVTKMALVELFLATNEQLARAETLAEDAHYLFLKKGEPPRVVGVLGLRFQVALRRGDADAALGHARERLCLSYEANLLNDAEIAAARIDMANAFNEAGFALYAARLHVASS